MNIGERYKGTSDVKSQVMERTTGCAHMIDNKKQFPTTSANDSGKTWEEKTNLV